MCTKPGRRTARVKNDANPMSFMKAKNKMNAKFFNPFDVLESKSFGGLSNIWGANSLRLLALPNEILNMVETGDLSAGHARSLIGLNNAIEIAKRIIQKNL